MKTFPVHTPQTAPAASRVTMENLRQGWGFLPNLGAVLAESPAALELIYVGFAALTSKGLFDPVEQQIVAIAASRENGCRYCVAAHSTMAAGAGMATETLHGVREGSPMIDKKHEALRALTQALVVKRGWLSEDDKRSFFAAGYTSAHLLEAIAWVSLKTLTNYTNHVAETPLDDAWKAQAWNSTLAVAV